MIEDLYVVLEHMTCLRPVIAGDRLHAMKHVPPKQDEQAFELVTVGKVVAGKKVAHGSAADLQVLPEP